MHRGSNQVHDVVGYLILKGRCMDFVYTNGERLLRHESQIARVRLKYFYCVYDELSHVNDTVIRFGLALAKSANAPIKNHKALEEWLKMKKKNGKKYNKEQSTNNPYSD